MAVAAVFQSKYVGRRAAEKFVDLRAVGNVGGVSVERQEGELGVVLGHPPGVKSCAVRTAQPDVLDRKVARVPIAFEPARIVGEEDEV